MVLVIRRDLRRDERGVASTVGTIMALLVFLTFLSLIVNQYVPVWMKDSEASHMDGAVGQFGDLKSAIDFQILGALMAQNAGAVFIPTTTSSPITLGVDGVPIFSSPTTGFLAFNGSSAPWFIQFAYRIPPTPGGVLTPVYQNGSGQIDLNVGNRYYPTGDIVYENGAVIRAQPDGQVIRAAPVFQVTKSASNLSVAFELVNLYGQGTASGTSAQIVDTKVFGVNQQTYTGITPQGVIISHTSAYGLAWYNFFNSTLSSSLQVTQVSYSSKGGLTQVQAVSPGAYYSINMVYVPTTNLYSIIVTINNLPTSPLSLTFTLQQAYVNVGIGQSSNEV